MDLGDRVRQIHGQLSTARAGEVEQLRAALQRQRVIGVLGEAEVGKTTLIEAALRAENPLVVHLDLDGAGSPEHVAFLLARQIAAAIAGAEAVALLATATLVPSAILQHRQKVADLLGLAGLDEATARWPTGNYPLPAALDALEQLASNGRVVLWIDHVESPALTPRHPLDYGRLLWALREMSQREANLRIVVSARLAMEQELLGPREAFHQLGEWITVGRPSLETWLNVSATRGSERSLTERLVSLTGGHPGTMLLALLAADEVPNAAVSPDQIVRYLAISDDGLAARAMQHARTLHRLGGQVLLQVALGEPPYGSAQRGKNAPQEIRKVLNRLRLAGLLRREGGWSLVNPLLESRLRGTIADVGRPVTDAQDVASL